MARRLSAEERTLWRKVIRTVRPIDEAAWREPTPEPEPVSPPGARTGTLVRKAPTPPAAPAAPAASGRPAVGVTLDGGWDRRLSRGLVAPERVVDLHGHGLASAHALLEARLEEAIADDVRLLLVVTGRPPRGDARPIRRGAIRASIGDWLAASRHASAIAAVRNAHPRHGGQGALYIVLRRRRPAP